MREIRITLGAVEYCSAVLVESSDPVKPIAGDPVEWSMVPKGSDNATIEAAYLPCSQVLALVPPVTGRVRAYTDLISADDWAVGDYVLYYRIADASETIPVFAGFVTLS